MYGHHTTLSTYRNHLLTVSLVFSTISQVSGMYINILININKSKYKNPSTTWTLHLWYGFTIFIVAQFISASSVWHRSFVSELHVVVLFLFLFFIRKTPKVNINYNQKLSTSLYTNSPWLSQRLKWNCLNLARQNIINKTLPILIYSVSKAGQGSMLI